MAIPLPTSIVSTVLANRNRTINRTPGLGIAGKGISTLINSAISRALPSGAPTSQPTVSPTSTPSGGGGGYSGGAAIAPQGVVPQVPQQVKWEISDEANQFQTDYEARLKALQSPLKIPDEMKSEISALTEGLEIPEAPDLTKYFQEYREQTGITQMEAILGQLQSDYRDAEARTRARRNQALGDQVSMDVIGGRVSEVERQGQEELSFVGRQIQVVNDQLNTQYKLMDTMMNLEQMDYDNALKTYQTKYNERMKAYELLRTQESMQFDQNMRLIQFERDSAMANLQIYIDLISNGTLNAANLSDASKLAINKLEIQSGLGLGFISKIQPPPGSNIKSITTRTAGDGNQYADILTVNQDGSISVSSQLIGSVYRQASGGSSGKEPEDPAVKMRADFMGSLQKPSVPVVTNAQQRADAEKYGEPYQTRETLIKRLQLEYNQIDPRDIANMVYKYYPDS